MNTLVQQIKPDNALMRLGDQQVACRVEGGFIVRASRKLRLFYGPELYAACKGAPGPLEKVSPFQPGYMKLAAALGGTLTVPPTVRDPVTGAPTANPIVEFVPGTSVIRSVRATAVCVARDPMGVYHASVQTITVDAESVLRQALLKIEREEIVQILSDEDVAADKKEGKLRGFVIVPFMPGYSLVGKAGAQPIREALQTYNNLSATIRQRACTKAERLACDHNPVMRMTWVYGELLIDIQEEKTGRMDRTTVAAGVPTGWAQVSPAYAEIDVTAWTESRGQAAMEAFVQSLASQQHVDGVESVVVGETADVDNSEIDDDSEEVPAVRQIAENPVPPAAIQAPKPDPVPVVVAPVAAPVAAPESKMVREVAVSRDGGQTIESGPDTTYSGKPAAPEVSPDLQKLRDRCTSLITNLPEKEVRFARTKSGFGDADISACTEIGPLRRLQTELVAISNDLNR